MLKSFVQGARLLAYFLITLEMIFMVTPFALYYYSAYAPFLSATSGIPALAWLPGFFLPHLSTDIVPSIGGLILLVGIAGFLVEHSRSVSREPEILFGWNHPRLCLRKHGTRSEVCTDVFTRETGSIAGSHR